MQGSPEQSLPSRPSDPGAVIDQVTESLRATANQVVPWFLEQMPTMYFQDTSPETQLAHIQAITAAKASAKAPNTSGPWISAPPSQSCELLEGQGALKSVELGHEVLGE